MMIMCLWYGFMNDVDCIEAVLLLANSMPLSEECAYCLRFSDKKRH